MHIFFSGIGGTGIGPLALIAKQAGYEVSGSDKQDSQYIQYLKKQGINDIHIGQTREAIEAVHANKQIDWYVYSSAIEKENAKHPELAFAKDSLIRTSKRDEMLNLIINEKQLKLLAVAGTHGKTTTTAMLIYLLQKSGTPLSYSVGAKISFGEMGHYEPGSDYLVLEADEFDRNFLSFSPFMAIISGISYDHHEIYPTEDSYQEAFRQFLGQSTHKVIWKSDAERIKVTGDDSYQILDSDDPIINGVNLAGKVNREDAWLAISAAHQVTGKSLGELTEIIDSFPGLSRRMEQISPGIYSDYAHTTDKIVGAVEIGLELASQQNKRLVVIYEPLTNRRMHYTAEQHHDIFNQVDKLYWVPSYLAREDPNQHVLTPSELIKYLDPGTQTKAQAANFDQELRENIESELANNAIVVALSGGGGGSLDEWLREKFSS